MCKYMTEEQKQKQRDWWANHPEAKEMTSRQTKEWRLNNPKEIEKMKQKQREWWVNHPEFGKGKRGTMSEETKKKMSETKKGKKRPPRSKEWCEKLSNSVKECGRIYEKGENNPRWKGGKNQFTCLDCKKPISKNNKSGRCLKCSYKYRKDNNLNKSREYHLIRFSKKFKTWRDLVFIRDSFTCRKCGQIGNELHPHHILNFNDHKKERFDIENGITLCVSCHRLFHKLYGQKNNTQEQLKEFMDMV